MEDISKDSPAVSDFIEEGQEAPKTKRTRKAEEQYYHGRNAVRSSRKRNDKCDDRRESACIE